ncbi:MFS transporter [Bradyrhizobium sp. Ai1a-2]|uniref:MFS transporter n=1 Tax=Bradyrhizobium sp. Ai1a-2 TaxID=196490 RepID=UPI00040BE358|nr:MFS transporter [Bradyrhizobium sp. Ai1a-2]
MKQNAPRRAAMSQAAIVIAEFFGTCLWFSATAVAPEIAESLGRGTAEPLDLSSAVQIGFVTGTLLIGLTGFGDRFRASRIFALSALFGAAANAAIAILPMSLVSMQLCRFATGVALAGIYPIGMKLVVSWNPDSAGRVLSWLVAMLTLGTAFPHLIRYLDPGYEWHFTIIVASLLACAAALIILTTGDGPAAQCGRPMQIDVPAALREFKRPKLRAAALGYLGHMWELYAFWALVPLLAAAAVASSSGRIPLISFLIISAGALGCVIGGFIGRRTGGRLVAMAALLGSAAVCIFFPAIQTSPALLLALFVWGFFVIPDSPQLSSLAVMACKGDQVASTLALLNGTGFLLTVISIQLSLACWPLIGAHVTWLLAPGPVVGFVSLRYYYESACEQYSQASRTS